MNHSNVIDTPRPAGSKDLLGVDSYIEALVRFIGTAQMPTTLAIQGEWGSGKTSLMNQVRHALCEDPEGEPGGKPFYGIWINTWQYALMRAPESVLISVISGITNEIAAIIQKRHQSQLENTLDSVRGVLGRLAKAGAKTAVSLAGADSSVVDDLMAQSQSQSDVDAFREKLAGAIRECLDADRQAGQSTRGFLFFIDDLDRIDPPVAVQILELLKNLFEVEHCVFILAIDYDVVVKGLEPKFGPLTDKNEREFRSFFDKIIQLPFTMPVPTYRITEYLREALVEIGYYAEPDLRGMAGDTPLIEVLTNMVKLSTGANPRAVKRLINTLSLINIMHTVGGQDALTASDRLLAFGAVCVQIAYPGIYNMLLAEPGFTGWDEQLARNLRLAPLEEEEAETLSAYEEFGEEWQRIVYRAGRGNAWLGARVFNVSQLLSLIASCAPEGEDLEEAMERVLGFAAVTTVTSGNAGQTTKRKRRTFAKDGTEATFFRWMDDNLDEASRSATRAVYDNCRLLFGDLVHYAYSGGMLFLKVAHPKTRRAGLLQGFSGNRRFASKMTTTTGNRVLSIQFFEDDREAGAAAFFKELLAGYNMLADEAHQLEHEALDRLKPVAEHGE